jgi:hypothetical protein
MLVYACVAFKNEDIFRVVFQSLNQSRKKHRRRLLGPLVILMKMRALVAFVAQPVGEETKMKFSSVDPMVQEGSMKLTLFTFFSPGLPPLAPQTRSPSLIRAQGVAKLARPRL